MWRNDHFRSLDPFRGASTNAANVKLESAFSFQTPSQTEDRYPVTAELRGPSKGKESEALFASKLGHTLDGSHWSGEVVNPSEDN